MNPWGLIIILIGILLIIIGVKGSYKNLVSAITGKADTTTTPTTTPANAQNTPASATTAQLGNL